MGAKRTVIVDKTLNALGAGGSASVFHLMIEGSTPDWVVLRSERSGREITRVTFPPAPPDIAHRLNVTALPEG